MNPKTFTILCTLLPPELVIEINDHLIAAYRKENGQKCSQQIRQFVRYLDYSDGICEIIIDDMNAFIFEECEECREVISSLYRATDIDYITHNIHCGANWLPEYTYSRREILINGRLRCHEI